MIFYGHVPIISHDIDTIFLDLAGGEIPAAGVTDVSFIHLFFVNKKLPLTKLNPFALQCNHPFQKHHFGSGKTDRDHFMSLRLRKKIAPLPTEIDTSVSIVGLHTMSFNEERGADMTEKKIGKECNA
jgi:hypothetical protein